MEIVEFNGWRNNVRLSNGEVELIITRDVGPRVIRFGFTGEQNVFAEIDGQQGSGGEQEWMIRGGHRLWVAPEVKPQTYELDNSSIEIEKIAGGIRTRQPAGPLTGVVKTMEISLADDVNRVSVVHRLTNQGAEPVELAPWALSVMTTDGVAVIPMPEKIPHTERLTHNQEWSIWGYTDFSDPRWTFGSRYIFFRQDRALGPNKLGIAHREGWVAYLVNGFLFVKRFVRVAGAAYPDAGMNFETFSNEEFLELESLGPLVTLEPGAAATHEETWSLHRGIPGCDGDADVDEHILPVV